MISTRSVELLIDTVVCLTLVKWETVSGQFGGYLTRWSLQLPYEFTVASFDFCWMIAASISKGGAGSPGKLTRANDDSNPYDGRQQIPCRSRPGRGTAQMVVQKMQVVVQKMQVKPSFSFKPYLSNRRPMGGGCLQSSASNCRRGSYEKMCPMSRKTRIRCPLP